ncbi:MAG: protein tyrosine phosphatase [Gammaproteobacteria bacterium]|nr:MAG: protein tyrosine phosphatase [Pseudomonadota bacterium]PIE38157.1 MAG: protein tyrosine phosphatase [Gammaproteobacteria bacterium]
MSPTIYQVKKIQSGMLSVMAMPATGKHIENEFFGLKRLGVSKVVCLLEWPEQCDLGLGAEQEYCEKYGLEYESFPIPDMGLPDTGPANRLLDQLANEIANGKHVVIHCRAGIGRTGMMAGGILVKTGMSPADALKLISLARGVQVPDTGEQVQWLSGQVSVNTSSWLLHF